MTTATYTKTPIADLDYAVDWSLWLNGDTIATSVWAVPSGLTGHDEATTTTRATIWLSGGTLNHRYTVKNTITTAQEREESRILLITIAER